jgi:hypothetical protein
MVMIDLTYEKKSLGVISVTHVTNQSLLARSVGAYFRAKPQVRAFECGK